MDDAFSRGFRLHLADGRVLDGAEFPSGRVYVLDDPEYGFATVATSMEHILDNYQRARVERPDEELTQAHLVDECWHIELQQGDGWLPVTRPSDNRQAAAAALARRRERHPGRTFRVVRKNTYETPEDL